MRTPTTAAGLDDEQQVAVTAPRGPVCVLAGAGTGKTRTITRRIAHLVQTGHVSPGQVLAVTFTARAAGELRTRLRALGVSGVQARTFHAAALRQLRYFWPRAVGGPPWPLLEGKVRVVGQAAARLRADTDAASLRDFAGEIEWAKASLIGPEEYPAEVAKRHRSTPGPAEQVAAVYAGYETLKNGAERLDFDDLLLHTAAALEERRDIAEEFRERYRCFVVDEYQDVTALQQRVLDAWLGDRDDLTVVGDANQTIYSFAGATPRYLLDFPRRFPDAVLVRLQRDYRSTPQVVSAANLLIGSARDRPAGSRLRLVGQLAAGPDPEFAEYDDEPAEAAAVARRITALIADGTPAAEIAVLFRINAQSEGYEQALTEVGVPYQVRGGERFFQRPEVRRAMLALRSAEPVAAPLIDTVRAVLAPYGLTAEPPGGAAQRAQWESLLALVELAEELVAVEPDADLDRFVTELSLRADAAPADRAGRDAGVPAHREGPGVGCGVPGRAGRRHAADPARGRRPGRDRGGAPAALRRDHPRPPPAAAVLGAVPTAGRAAAAAPQPLPPRADPRAPPDLPGDGAGPDRRQAALPGLRFAPARCRGDEAAAVRRLPVERRCRAAGPAAQLAQLRGGQAARPGLCDLHRRHADRDRRTPPGRRCRAGRDTGDRRPQAGAVRGRRARPDRRHRGCAAVRRKFSVIQLCVPGTPPNVDAVTDLTRPSFVTTRPGRGVR